MSAVNSCLPVNEKFIENLNSYVGLFAENKLLCSLSIINVQEYAYGICITVPIDTFGCRGRAVHGTLLASKQILPERPHSRESPSECIQLLSQISLLSAVIMGLLNLSQNLHLVTVNQF